VETPLKFIKTMLHTKLCPLLQISSHIAQYFSLKKSVISEILEAAFATVLVIFQCQVSLILLQFVYIPPYVRQHDVPQSFI
jgi:hypothetical protein